MWYLEQVNTRIFWIANSKFAKVVTMPTLDPMSAWNLIGLRKMGKNMIESDFSCSFVRHDTDPSQHFAVDLSCLRWWDSQHKSIEVNKLWTVQFSDCAFDVDQKADVLEEFKKPWTSTTSIIPLTGAQMTCGLI